MGDNKNWDKRYDSETKTGKPVINEQIKNFLGTKEGRKYFAELTPELTHASRSEFKKSLIDPPKNIRRHLSIKALINNKINEVRLKNLLDNND